MQGILFNNRREISLKLSEDKLNFNNLAVDEEVIISIKVEIREMKKQIQDKENRNVLKQVIFSAHLADILFYNSSHILYFVLD